jgi:hypothetical protein
MAMKKNLSRVETLVGILFILVALGFIPLGNSDSARRIQLSIEMMQGSVVHDCLENKQKQHPAEIHLKDIKRYAHEMFDLSLSLRITIFLAGLYILANQKLRHVFENKRNRA